MPREPLAIISAIPQELDALREDAGVVTEVAGQRFERTTLQGRPVVLVEAGLGKVRAAVTTTLLVRELGCRGVVFSGVAGGLDPQVGIGDVVVAERVVQHDYGAYVGGRLVTYQPGRWPWPGADPTHGYPVQPALLRRVKAVVETVTLPVVSARITGTTERQARFHVGTVLTGDTFVNCEATRERLFHEFRAQAVEMEGGAVAQVAEQLGVPWLVVRSVSDLAGAESHLDFGAFVALVAKTAASVVRAVVPVFDEA